MHPPRMVIIAGPAGGGKSSLFPVSEMAGVDPFSNDDYCARLNGQRLGRAEPVYTGITSEIRQQGGAVMQKFIEDHIAARQSFAFETTLRDLTFEQARRASANGFRVEMVFIAAGPVEEHIERVKNRGELGGHSASDASLREI
ncbi:MAG: zeta toxin family protein [Bryobacteraceae bacterium]